MSDFYLPKDEKRTYELKIKDGILSISGDYWRYDISDIYMQRDSYDEVSTSEYLGIGKLKMRPQRYVVTFIVFPMIISLVSRLINHWIFKVLLSSDAMAKLSEAGNVLINILCAAFILVGIRLLFSMKDLIEISFISKHICIPRKSLSEIQYRTLCRSLGDTDSGRN